MPVHGPFGATQTAARFGRLRSTASARDGGQFGKRTMAGIPKLALDFLLRPATMTSRQHRYQGFPQDGENSLGNGNTTAAREGTGMRYGSCAGSRNCSAKNSPCFTPKPPPTSDGWEHQQMIVETT